MPFLEPASNLNDKVDNVFLYIFALSLLFLVGITATMLYFVVRYSRKRNPQATSIEGHTGLEIAWTVIPLILFLSMFYFGWTNFRYMRSAPRDALVVEVTGRQWSWSFKYPNGRVTQDLFAALDRPVKLHLVSTDVVHGFFVPAFRLKQDVVPGKTNEVWFIPKLLGSFDVECTVICGVSHTYMLSKVHVVPEAAFKAWYFGPQDAPLPAPNTVVSPVAALAAPAPEKPPAVALLEGKGCVACHSLDGSVTVGPTFKGRFGTRDVVRRGVLEQEITVDEAYVRRAIEQPEAEIVRGYPPTMPPTPLSEEELRLVVAYLKQLK